MTDPNYPTPMHVQRLLKTIYPSRFERVLIRVVTWCYTHPEGSVLDRLGDQIDRVVLVSRNVRARLAVHRASGS